VCPGIIIFPQIAVRSWWPNSYGEQKLYNLSAEFRNGDETSTKSVRIGFREIELVQEKIGEVYSPFKNQKTTNVAFSSIITVGNAV
jgi:hypothetical protein